MIKNNIYRREWLSVYKTGNIMSYLKKDNFYVYRKFIENEIPLKAISEKFNSTDQLTLDAIKKLDPHIMEKREQNINYRLETICDMVFEGVPIDYILNEHNIAKPFKQSCIGTSFNGYKDATIAKIRRRHICDVRKLRDYIVITDRLKHYIVTIQIEENINQTPKNKVNLSNLAKQYGVSYNKVLERNRSMHKHHRAITSLKTPVYEVLKRNVTLAQAYFKGTSLSQLRHQHKDLLYLDLIIQTYQPYIKIISNLYQRGDIK